MLKLKETGNARSCKSRFDSHIDLDWNLAPGGILQRVGRNEIAQNRGR